MALAESALGLHGRAAGLSNRSPGSAGVVQADADPQEQAAAAARASSDAGLARLRIVR
jgi:hypothetical protein